MCIKNVETNVRYLEGSPLDLRDGRRLNWSRAISELGMTNVPRAELRNIVGEDIELIQFAAVEQGFGTSPKRRKFAYIIFSSKI